MYLRRNRRKERCPFQVSISFFSTGSDLKTLYFLFAILVRYLSSPSTLTSLCRTCSLVLFDPSYSVGISPHSPVFFSRFPIYPCTSDDDDHANISRTYIYLRFLLFRSSSHPFPPNIHCNPESEQSFSFLGTLHGYCDDDDDRMVCRLGLMRQ